MVAFSVLSVKSRFYGLMSLLSKTYVPVHEMVFVKVANRRDDLVEVITGVNFCKTPILDDSVEQLPSRTQLRHYIVLVALFVDVEHLQDVGVILRQPPFTSFFRILYSFMCSVDKPSPSFFLRTTFTARSILPFFCTAR